MNITYTKNINGTSLQGYVEATLQELTNAFGTPTYFHPSTYDKTQIEWNLLIEDEESKTVVTIYDWKQYGFIPSANETVTWNIGGRNSEAVSKVKQILGK